MMTVESDTPLVEVIPPENIDVLMMALNFEAVAVQLLLKALGGDPWSAE